MRVQSEEGAFTAVISAAKRSRACRRDSRRTTSTACPRVTWYSQALSTVLALSLAALRARSLKTDWATSSASSRERTCRSAVEYTRFTCRCTSAVKASCEWSRLNCRSKSWSFAVISVYEYIVADRRNPTNFWFSDRMPAPVAQVILDQVARQRAEP